MVLLLSGYGGLQLLSLAEASLGYTVRLCPSNIRKVHFTSLGSALEKRSATSLLGGIRKNVKVYRPGLQLSNSGENSL